MTWTASTASPEPRRMMAPLPNWRSIVASASSSDLPRGSSLVVVLVAAFTITLSFLSSWLAPAARIEGSALHGLVQRPLGPQRRMEQYDLAHDGGAELLGRVFG